MQMWFPINLNKEAEHIIKEKTCRKLFQETTFCNNHVKELSFNDKSITTDKEVSLNIITAISIFTIAISALCLLKNNTNIGYGIFLIKYILIYTLDIAYKSSQILRLQFCSLKKYFHTIYFHIFKSYLRCHLSF